MRVGGGVRNIAEPLLADAPPEDAAGATSACGLMAGTNGGGLG